MKREPISNPKWHGCANCSKTPIAILHNDDTIWSFNLMSVHINGKSLEISENLTVEEFLKENTISKEDVVEIFYMSAFHDETYELDTEDMIFKLTKQGRGYA